MVEKLFLVDAMAMIYRAYFAMISSPLINSDGKNTSAVFGFVNSLVKILEDEKSLVKILEDEKPEYIAVCFDTEKPTFRHKEFPEYKAQRMEIPTDMPWQINKVKDVIRAMNIPLLELDGFEADDIIGTIAKRAEKEKTHTFMVTPDKDYMQLVTDETFLYKPVRNVFGNKIADVEIVNKEGVFKKFGVTPDKVVDVLGLMGDSSDNIPGVKGVGEKTAIALIQEFGSMENLYEAIDKVSKPKLKEKLIEHKDMAFLSKRLVTIDTDSPVKIDYHNLKRIPPDRNKLTELFSELNFKTLLRKFSGDSDNSSESKKSKKDNSETDNPEIKIRGQKIETVKVDIKEPPKKYKNIKDVKHHYYTIKNSDEYIRMIKKLSSEEIICFDTETDSKDPMLCNLVGMSFAYKEEEAYYVPVYGNIKNSKSNDSLFDAKSNDSLFDKPKSENFVGVEINEALEKIKPLLENKKIKIVGQNIIKKLKSSDKI